MADFFFLNSHLFISILYENSEQENLKIIMNFEFSYILLLLFHACYTLFPHSKYNEREIRKKKSAGLYPVFLHTQNKTNSSSIILQHFEQFFQTSAFARVVTSRIRSKKNWTHFSFSRVKNTTFIVWKAFFAFGNLLVKWKHTESTISN